MLRPYTNQKRFLLFSLLSRGERRVGEVRPAAAR
jgi:hypothetical protein